MSAALAAIPERLQNADHVVLALDFDGTLAPIAASPDKAELPTQTAEALRELAALRNVSIVILSGRSLADLKSKVELDCILAGNHGLEIESLLLSFREPRAEALRPAIARACGELEETLKPFPGVFVERKYLTATVHYRQASDDLTNRIREAVFDTMRCYGPSLFVRAARKAWEIRPQLDWNKGTALRYVLTELGLANSLIVCAGDDRTDEDTFAAFPDSISIHVGAARETAAQYHVDGPGELALFLRELQTLLG